jgi:protein DGCR14
MNSLMFLPDANENPYPKPKPPPAAKPPANPPTIAYRNTRLAEEEDEPSGRAGSTRRGSSPARSWIDAAVRGTECKFSYSGPPDLSLHF